jgi:hypothetical protein
MSDDPWLDTMQTLVRLKIAAADAAGWLEIIATVDTPVGARKAIKEAHDAVVEADRRLVQWIRQTPGQ